jgi:hypothetical protein
LALQRAADDETSKLPEREPNWASVSTPSATMASWLSDAQWRGTLGPATGRSPDTQWPLQPVPHPETGAYWQAQMPSPSQSTAVSSWLSDATGHSPASQWPPEPIPHLQSGEYWQAQAPSPSETTATPSWLSSAQSRRIPAPDRNRWPLQPVPYQESRTYMQAYTPTPSEYPFNEPDFPTAPPGVDINRNIDLARRNHLNPFWPPIFYYLVRPTGRWDFKHHFGSQYQDFGNFHYGATAAPVFPESIIYKEPGSSVLWTKQGTGIMG